MALIANNSSSSPLEGEVDPLLKDLSEKKHTFRQNLVTLAAELKEVRSRLASQEQLFAHETLTRQEAENKVKSMEEKIIELQVNLEKKNLQLQETAADAEKYCKGLDDLRSRLSATQDIIDASVASAHSAELQCLLLLKELDEKNIPLKEQELRLDRLTEQLDRLEHDLKAREYSEKQLRDEVLGIEYGVVEALVKVGSNKDDELRKLRAEISLRNSERMNRRLTQKDEEIQKLRDELAAVSAHWKLKTKDLESLLEKQSRADEDMQKRVLKLEFCLQEARAETRKLQLMGERREKTIKELRDELASIKQQHGGGSAKVEKNSFWESSGFKVLISVSMLLLVLFSKR